MTIKNYYRIVHHFRTIIIMLSIILILLYNISCPPFSSPILTIQDRAWLVPSPRRGQGAVPCSASATSATAAGGASAPILGYPPFQPRATSWLRVDTTLRSYLDISIRIDALTTERFIQTSSLRCLWYDLQPSHGIDPVSSNDQG